MNWAVKLDRCGGGTPPSIRPSREGRDRSGGSGNACGSRPPLGRKNHSGSFWSAGAASVASMLGDTRGAVPRPPASRSAKSSSIFAAAAGPPLPNTEAPEFACTKGCAASGGVDSSASVLRIEARISSRFLPAVLSKLLIPHLTLGPSDPSMQKQNYGKGAAAGALRDRARVRTCGGRPSLGRLVRRCACIQDLTAAVRMGDVHIEPFAANLEVMCVGVINERGDAELLRIEPSNR